jgi:hypothetical protein
MTQLNLVGEKIQNPHDTTGKLASRVQGDLDPKVFDYFFKQVIPWSYGARQALICFFFQRLYEECQRLEIPPHWDEEFGPKTIVDILNRMNFK